MEGGGGVQDEGSRGGVQGEINGWHCDDHW